MEGKEIVQKESSFLEDKLDAHFNYIVSLANRRLAERGKEYILTESNMSVLKFLICYFNGDDNATRAKCLINKQTASLYKNIMIIGDTGVGKTFMMEIVSEYLRNIRSSRNYTITSQFRLMQYYFINHHIDYFTYNELGFYKGKPIHFCINDIGIKSEKHFGNSTDDIVSNFLLARDEIFAEKGVKTHITTNIVNVDEFKERFDFRVVDRLKTYNILHLEGDSMR